MQERMLANRDALSPPTTTATTVLVSLLIIELSWDVKASSCQLLAVLALPLCIFPLLQVVVPGCQVGGGGGGCLSVSTCLKPGSRADKQTSVKAGAYLSWGSVQVLKSSMKVLKCSLSSHLGPTGSSFFTSLIHASNSCVYTKGRHSVAVSVPLSPA